MNSEMQYSWNCAIDILKPSKKELEHGLELHKDTIVFDAYGFAPSMPPDAGLLKKAVEKGSSHNELKDLIEEMSMTRHLNVNKLLLEYLEAWDVSGVTCVFQNAGEETNDSMQILKRFARFTHVTDKLKDFISKAAFPEDIEKAEKDKRHCMYFSTNGIPLVQKWESAEAELGFIKVFFQLGCRMMHFTYNRRNLMGDGCAESSDAGLSDFGKMAVKEMNRVGIICDVAHSGWRTSAEVAKVSEKPIVSSHSTCCAIKRHIRSKPDDVIKAIVESGGYNGKCCIPCFLGGSGDINSLLDHIDYMIKKFGSDSVAIGSDSGYLSSSVKEEREKCSRILPKSRNAWEQFWPEGAFTEKWNKKAAASLAWTNWPLFTVGLVKRGIPTRL